MTRENFLEHPPALETCARGQDKEQVTAFVPISPEEVTLLTTMILWPMSQIK